MADKRGGLSPGALGLVNQAENHFGKSFNISSGHRDAAYNASLPGAAKNSDHLTGDAFDISTKGMSGNQAAEVSNYYRSLPNTYVKDDYADGHIHVSYRGPDNKQGHVNKGAKDTPDPGPRDGSKASGDGATKEGEGKTDGSTNQNKDAQGGKNGQTPQQKQQNTNTDQNNCNPKVTGTGKPIGTSTNGKSGQNGQNGSGGSGSKNGQNGQGGTNPDGSKKQGSDAGGNNKLENTGQTKNLKYNQAQADKVYNGLRDRGYSHEQASAVMGHWYNESKFNTNITGDNGTSYGIAQWHNERWDNLNNFASQTGRSPSDLNTQLDFFDKEIRGSHANMGGNALRNATTIAEASQAMNNYERFAGWNTGGSQVYDRLNNANTFNGAYQGRR